MTTTPLRHRNKRTKESKKTVESDERADDERLPAAQYFYSATRYALDNLHIDVARIAALSEAAHGALDGLPRPADQAQRNKLRRLEAFVVAIDDYASDALARADKVVDEIETRTAANDW